MLQCGQPAVIFHKLARTLVQLRVGEFCVEDVVHILGLLVHAVKIFGKVFNRPIEPFVFKILTLERSVLAVNVLAHEIFLITIKLAPFYIAYAGCAIIDNYFVGTGHTIYNAINSLIINLGYYGIFFILYLTKAITFTMDVIILMFGFGMVVHLIISVIEERLFFRKRELKRLLAEQTNLV